MPFNFFEKPPAENQLPQDKQEGQEIKENMNFQEAVVDLDVFRKLKKEHLSEASFSGEARGLINKGVEEYLRETGRSGVSLEHLWTTKGGLRAEAYYAPEEVKRIKETIEIIQRSITEIGKGRPQEFNEKIAGQLVGIFREKERLARQKGDEDAAKACALAAEEYRDLQGVLLKEAEKPKQEEGERLLIEECEKMARENFGAQKDADYEMYVAKKQGCWYFSPHSKERGKEILRENSFEINALQEEAENKFGSDQSSGRNMEIGRGAKFMEEHFDEICQEYKIHLQPEKEKSENRPFCVSKLLKALSENPEFRESINRFKVSYGKEVTESESGEVVPEIVIYTRYGRENFEKALDCILQTFEGDEDRGSDATPRYNHKINKLIFVAQSGGDFKESLNSFGVGNKYFDRQFNYAFRIGEKPPGFREIKEAESFVELFKLLEQFKGLQGEKRFYKVAELKRLINQVRGKKEPLEIITRAEGLREKVEGLLENKQIYS